MRVTDALLAIIALVFTWNVYRAQRNTALSFDLFDLILENGRVSKASVAFMVTLAATTWVMIRLTMDGKLTELYFGAYGTMWVAPIVARLFTNPANKGPDNDSK